MAGIKVELDRRGVREVLLSQEMRDLVNTTAEQIATNARQSLADPDKPVVVDSYTTDRGAASITIAHDAGLAEQAKTGVLTKAAGDVGLEVKS